MQKLVECLEDPADRVLAEAILGTADPVAIHAALDGFCRAHLRVRLTEVTFCELSVGAGFGLALDDGRRVFLKAWSRATHLPLLEAVHTVQAALAARGFPAPGVLLAPRPFLAGHAAVLEWLERGEPEDANRPALRRAMAATLARLVELAAPYRELAALPRGVVPRAAIWPTPHNVLFDFAATREGAEWIDAIGAASRAALRRGVGRLVVGHRDWSAKNLRFEGEAVSAVYDWDSLAVAREPVLVGMAAATHPVTWSLPVRRFPPPAQMSAFIADYEAARGWPFTPKEWQAASAAATYLLAYTARCEHAGAPDSELPPDSARRLLREYALHSPTDPAGLTLPRLRR